MHHHHHLFLLPLIAATLITSLSPCQATVANTTKSPVASVPQSSTSSPTVPIISTSSVSGVFNVPRKGICYEVIATLTPSSEPMRDETTCMRYTLQDLVHLTHEYVTYQLVAPPANNKKNKKKKATVIPPEYRSARLGAVTVRGALDGGAINLNYACPPPNYNGVGPGCVTQANTQLIVLNLDENTKDIKELNIILSGAPFPEVIQANKPPFGMAKLTFEDGLKGWNDDYLATMGEDTVLTICRVLDTTKPPHGGGKKHDNRRGLVLDDDQKQKKKPTTKKQPRRRCETPKNRIIQMRSNTADGYFKIPAFDLQLHSVWVMDMQKKQLILTVGPNTYYFNNTGFYFYDAAQNTCIWSGACNFDCEVYNYDSRFLDFAGDWIIKSKLGVTLPAPVQVSAWIGNAIDAAGVFPCIAYLTPGFLYQGLDKLDTIPAPKAGASFWYGTSNDKYEKGDIASFHPNVAENNCGNLDEWIGGA